MEPLEFPCPACEAPLSVPAASAGVVGPCPKCGTSIVAPDPASAWLPRIAPLTPPPTWSAFAPFRPPVAPPRAPKVPQRPADPAAAALSATPAPSSGPDAASGPLLEIDRRISPNRRNARLSNAFLLLIGLGVGFAIGYALREPRKPADEKPVPELRQAQDDPADELPKDPPTAEGPPAKSASEDRAEAVVPGPRVTLEDFLAEAGTAFLSIEPEQAHEEFHLFRVKTIDQPAGFPVAVMREEAGWRVNEESFAEFAEDRFRKFAKGAGEAAAEFKLLLKPAEQGAPNELFAAYHVQPPMPDRSAIAYARNGTVVESQLRAVLANELGHDDGVHRELLAGSGLPLVLQLKRGHGAGGGVYLEVEEVVASGWGPR